MNRIRKIGLGVVVGLVAIQFYRPAKNISTEISANAISAPEEVQNILKKSCNDCHSNNTVYPWYNNIQPVAGWLAHHINEGKGELNFDEFTSYSPRKQYHKLEETIEMVKENEMPLPSYTWTHKDAILTDAEKGALVEWAKYLRRDLENTYPKDSLIFKRKP